LHYYSPQEKKERKIKDLDQKKQLQNARQAADLAMHQQNQNNSAADVIVTASSRSSSEVTELDMKSYDTFLRDVGASLEPDGDLDITRVAADADAANRTSQYNTSTFIPGLGIRTSSNSRNSNVDPEEASKWSPSRNTTTAPSTIEESQLPDQEDWNNMSMSMPMGEDDDDGDIPNLDGFDGLLGRDSSKSQGGSMLGDSGSQGSAFWNSSGAFEPDDESFYNAANYLDKDVFGLDEPVGVNVNVNVGSSGGYSPFGGISSLSENTDHASAAMSALALAETEFARLDGRGPYGRGGRGRGSERTRGPSGRGGPSPTAKGPPAKNVNLIPTPNLDPNNIIINNINNSKFPKDVSSPGAAVAGEEKAPKPARAHPKARGGGGDKHKPPKVKDESNKDDSAPKPPKSTANGNAPASAESKDGNNAAPKPSRGPKPGRGAGRGGAGAAGALGPVGEKGPGSAKTGRGGGGRGPPGPKAAGPPATQQQQQ
jgi:hypothetical protein